MSAHQPQPSVRPCISFPPIDCTDRCSNGLCDCSGVWRDGCGRRDETEAMRLVVEAARAHVDRYGKCAGSTQCMEPACALERAVAVYEEGL